MSIFLVRMLRVRPYHRVLFLLGGVIACLFIGGAVFAATQHIPVTRGWYWALETATTVGYGDVTPSNAAGRVVASVVMLTTIPMLAGAFALVTGSAVAIGVRRLMQGAKHGRLFQDLLWKLDTLSLERIRELEELDWRGYLTRLGSVLNWRLGTDVLLHGP